MSDDIQNQINLHSAGATIRHYSSFDHLESYKNNFELSKKFIDKWVIPFYMNIRNTGDVSWIEQIKELKDEITEEITLTLLGNFNWRTRLVGAYFSAIKNYQNQIDIIGVHLLKSEVCCVGDLYALVLAFYNHPKTIQYLNQYLDYYLHKPELYFDQESVLCAIAYLDSINSTNHLSNYIPHWADMKEKRELTSKARAVQVALIIEKQEGKQKAEEYIHSVNNLKNISNLHLNIEEFSEQIKLLKELRTYCL